MLCHCKQLRPKDHKTHLSTQGVDPDHRVVFVSGSVKLGGATTFLLNLAGELVSRGIPVLVISLEDENPYASDFQQLRIPLHVEDDRTTIFEDRISAALKVIRHFEPTAVISCLGPSSYEILRYVPEWVTRLAMLQSDYPGSYPVFAAYVPFLDGTVGVSRQIEANLRAHSILGRVPAHYLPYGVPIPQNRLRSAWKCGEPIRILYFGRLSRSQKRVHLFPEILRQLKAVDLPFQWTIAGDGPERARLEQRMIEAPSKSVITFPGPIKYADVPGLLDRHDVFLLTSDEEGLPLSLLEAMAHGLVPVISDLPSGVSEVVDQECGILVDPSDVDGYAAGIIWLAQNPSAFSAMAEKAPLRVRTNFSVAAMTDRWLTLLNRMDKGRQQVWPQTFTVTGPLNHDSLWYREPIRTIRRVVRPWSCRSVARSKSIRT